MFTPIEELIFLVLQFLYEENWSEAAQMLEQESKIYFNLNRFSVMIITGRWNDAEEYLRSFTIPEDNLHSRTMFWIIGKHKYLEALDAHNLVEAVKIFEKDLKFLQGDYPQVLEELAKLIALDNFRENPEYSMYGDTRNMRDKLVKELENLTKMNPKLQRKLNVPDLHGSRLKILLNHSLRWQHFLCGSEGEENPFIMTFFEDHKCPQASAIPSRLPLRFLSPSNLGKATIDEGGSSSSHREHEPDDQVERRLKRPMMEPSAYSQLMSNITMDLPKNHIFDINVVNSPTSFGFHPDLPTILLVGTNESIIYLWDLKNTKLLFHDKLKLGAIQEPSEILKEALSENAILSVTCVVWSPDGCLFGVGYSKNVVRIYSYNVITKKTKLQYETECHIGRVMDIKFAGVDGNYYYITCGEDTTIKVWDVATGDPIHTLADHNAPVTAILPHERFLISSSADGYMKVWNYDWVCGKTFKGPAYRFKNIINLNDTMRFYTCWTDMAGNSEMYESEGNIDVPIKLYQGLRQPSIEQVKFDAYDKIIVAGDHYSVKFWHTGRPKMIHKIEGNGNFQGYPIVRLNFNASILAVSANEGRVRIFANNEGCMYLGYVLGESSTATKIQRTRQHIILD